MVAGVVIIISHYILVDRAYQFLHIRPATGPRKAGIGICNYRDDYLPVGGLDYFLFADNPRTDLCAGTRRLHPAGMFGLVVTGARS